MTVDAGFGIAVVHTVKTWTPFENAWVGGKSKNRSALPP
jgi:hypothetical protein